MTAIIDQYHQRIDPTRLFPALEPARAITRELADHYPEIAEVQKAIGVFIGNTPLTQIFDQATHLEVGDTPTPPPADMNDFIQVVQWLEKHGINPPPTFAPTATEVPSTATPAPIVVESGETKSEIQNTEIVVEPQEESKSDANVWTYLFLLLGALGLLGLAKDVIKSFKNIRD